MPVGEMGHYPFLASAHLELLEAEDVSLDLHERHVGHQLWYEVDFGSVNVFVRIILKKVTVGADSKLFAQNLLALRANTRQVHDVL